MNDIGFPIALACTIISLAGVYYLNQKNFPLRAKQFWFFSNPMMTIYFAGRYLGFWNGGLGDVAMAGLYFVMSVSNAKGLWDEYNDDPLAGWYEYAKEKVRMK